GLSRFHFSFHFGFCFLSESGLPEQGQGSSRAKKQSPIDSALNLRVLLPQRHEFLPHSCGRDRLRYLILRWRGDEKRGPGQNRLHRQEHRFTNLGVSNTADTANVIIRPPIAWALAVLAALALQWLMPLPFMPAAVPAGWVGGAVFAIALALAAW